MNRESGKTVLVVEDSAMSREKIVSILKELGCVVLAAADGLEGVKLAKERGSGINLVVLDIQMPKMDGITALRYMRQIPEMAAVPIVMLTTQVDTDTVRTALSHKATDFIRKDASIPKITERLKGYLQGELKREAAAESPDPKLAEAITKGSRRYHPREKGPYILCFEAASDLQALGAAKDKGLLAFYQQMVAAINGLKGRYPGLEPGYWIEPETKEVTRLVKREAELVKLVLVSGRRAEGWSLARMVRFVQQDSPPVLLLCDAISSLPLEQRDGAVKAGVELVERREMHADRMEELVDEHLLAGMRTTRSGLKFLALAQGTGSLAQAGQQATVHYTAMLQDGTVLDDTGKRGEPYRFLLGHGAVISGWEEGMLLMKQGGKAFMVIPPELGYGEAGDGKVVPPNATLILSVELVAVGLAPKEDTLV